MNDSAISSPIFSALKLSKDGRRRQKREPETNTNIDHRRNIFLCSMHRFPIFGLAGFFLWLSIIPLFLFDFSLIKFLLVGLEYNQSATEGRSEGGRGGEAQDCTDGFCDYLWHHAGC